MPGKPTVIVTVTPTGNDLCLVSRDYITPDGVHRKGKTNTMTAAEAHELVRRFAVNSVRDGVNFVH